VLNLNAFEESGFLASIINQVPYQNNLLSNALQNIMQAKMFPRVIEISLSKVFETGVANAMWKMLDNDIGYR
jgi:hypothetical protein